jgi:putative colanic acid biosynthesis UDP-glucose lipid carrier transferase
MLGNRSFGIRALSVFLLVVLVTFSYWGWFFIWQSELMIDITAVEKYLVYNEFLLIGILFGGATRSPAFSSQSEFVEAVRSSGRQAVLGLFTVFVLVFALHDTFLSRSFFFSYIPCLYGTLLFSNYILPKWLGRWAFSGNREERVALAGTIEQAGQFKPWLERKALLGLRAVGMVCPRPNGTNGADEGVAPFPVLGCMDELSGILKSAAITQLIVLDLSLGPQRLGELVQLCEERAVRLLALHNLDSYFNHTTMTFEDDGVRFIGLRDEPLESPMNRFLKRIMDLLIAIPVVLVVLPVVTLLVWLIQRFQSPGPVFFKQSRIGMMGREFEVIKYRTMHMNHGSEHTQASKDDPRVYPAGYWLRRLSLDELPQFINVLKGDMSVVGPRPHLKKHEEVWLRIMQKYVIRRFIRPGITGWAQVSGFRGEIRTEKDIQKRVEADIHYLESWSLSLDLAILLKTAKHCLLPPPTAY